MNTCHGGVLLKCVVKAKPSPSGAGGGFLFGLTGKWFVVC